VTNRRPNKDPEKRAAKRRRQREAIARGAQPAPRVKEPRRYEKDRPKERSRDDRVQPREIPDG
jgi:hypothetical protein